VTWAFANWSEALAGCESLVVSGWIRPLTTRWRSIV